MTASATRVRAHLPPADLDALALSLMTDEQAFASFERWKMVAYVEAIYEKVGE